MAWAGSLNAPGPFTFRGCDLRGEYLPAKEEVRVQLPATAPCLQRLSVSTQPSFQNSAYSGQHGGSLPFSGVVADKQCTCFASKPIWERYPSTPLFHCGENEIQVSFISSTFVGATPTPATNFSGKRSSCPTVNRVSLNKAGSDELERYQRFPPYILDP